MAGIPIGRVIEKLDELLNLNDDYKAGERHLKYWLEEARSLQDDQGAFTVVNELIGMYRKWGMKEQAMGACETAKELTARLGIEDEVGGATAYLNIATACKAFGNAAEAVELYKRAERIYERDLDSNDPRLAGLYNNLGLALTDTAAYDEAEQCFRKAIEIVSKKKNGEADCAISYLNLAEMLERKMGFEAAEEKILSYMDKGWELLNTPTLPRDGYYAFVAEKCFPLFRHYEYYLIANELESRVKTIRSSRGN
ncbi:MAG: tetratricopeptide repeat protein [Eubacteriales bacterium]|nr:tetratricopeptide repeat protein [Eubacteriales bacterium]